MCLSIKHSLHYTDIYEYVYDLPDIPIPNYSMYRKPIMRPYFKIFPTENFGKFQEIRPTVLLNTDIHRIFCSEVFKIF